MNLSVGIVGLPNVGKSTLFNALTKQSVDAANYPFCTIDPSVGVVEVPDLRLGQLSTFSNSEKTIPAAVQFVDIAGLVKGASEGQGLGNQFLSHIREVDAIAHVVRIFEHADIIHVAGHIDPEDDIKVINLELVLADLAVVNKRLSSVEKDVRAGISAKGGSAFGGKEAIAERDGLVKVKAALEAETFARTVHLTEEEAKEVEKLNLLTAKKTLYVLNVQSGGKNLDELPAYAEAPAYADASAGRSAGKKDERWEKLLAFLNEEGASYVIVDAALESDLNSVADAERTTMRESLAVRGGIDSLIVAGYDLLDLITFFTTGETETRAWTIQKSSTAPVAGAAIHTDFKDKFIRAEVVFWKDLIESGSYAKAREKGLVRTEGKGYIVKDGDVIEFKI